MLLNWLGYESSKAYFWNIHACKIILLVLDILKPFSKTPFMTLLLYKENQQLVFERMYSSSQYSNADFQVGHISLHLEMLYNTIFLLTFLVKLNLNTMKIFRMKRNERVYNLRSEKKWFDFKISTVLSLLSRHHGTGYYVSC